MSDETRIYLELDAELQQALDDNGIRIEDILREAGVEGRVSRDVLPVQDDSGAQSRDLMLAIDLLAGVALIASFGFTLSKILNTVYSKPIYVAYEEPVELRDTDGNVVLDAKGKPVFKKVPRHEILQPQQSSKESFMTDLKKMVLKASVEKQQG